MSKNKIIIYCYSISLNGTLVTFNFQFSICETQQLHIVYFNRCNWYVSTLHRRDVSMIWTLLTLINVIEVSISLLRLENDISFNILV